MGAYRLLICVLIVLLVFTSGCTSLSIGNIVAGSDGITVHVTNSGDPVDGSVHVRVYQIRGMEQKELVYRSVDITLKSGENTVIVPIPLEQGTYKMNIYVMVNSERQTATIKDIVI